MSLALTSPLDSGQPNTSFSLDASRLERVLHKTVDQRYIFGAVVSISAGKDCWTGAQGNLSKNSQYFIASTTKLYITALVLQLRAAGQLQLQDTISTYLPPEVMQGLHDYQGVSYSEELTVCHLLSHTSGLADYFEQQRVNGRSLRAEITSGVDQDWTSEEAIQASKTMQPKFRPGQAGKAFYSDTNFQLLARIIEHISGQPLAEVLATRLFEPLALKNTYLYQNPADTKPAQLYYRNKPLVIPRAMASFGADGGIVSTAEESLLFIKSFFQGKLFPLSYLKELMQWNRLFFPLQYGIGLARFKLPRIFSPFRPLPELLGHSGLSGAFAYYCPEKEVYLAGTVNQVAKPNLPYQLMLRLLQTG